MVNKIIAMSVWGDNPRYIEGAKRQIELASEFYSDWKVYLYTDDTSKYEPQENLKLISCQGHNGVFWRFYPLFESDNNITIVRDSDGRITKREAMAIEEWLESDQTFHIYRDHEAHFQFPIIACAFGLKGKLSEKLLLEMKTFEQEPFYYTNDQVYLRDHIFPAVSNNALIHTMESGWFGETRNQLVNPYSFCGNGYDEYDMPLYPGTLAECENFDPKSVDAKYRFDKGIMR